MIYDNMMLPENTLPLDNIVSAQNAANLQNMWTAQNNRMISQNMTTLQDRLAQQSAATSRNNAAPQNNMASPNMMPARNMSTMAVAQANRSSAGNKLQAKQQLAQSCFAVHEAVLYLDTHPNDQNALEYYRKKQQQLIQANENYQKIVGPTRSCMVDTNSGSWRWIETPWPWEIEED